MPRGCYLSDIEKGKISAFWEEGISIREISRRLKRSDKVVRTFLKDPANYGQNKKGGPKEKLSKRDKRRIIQTASNSAKSGAQIARECHLNVSRWTVNRVLKQSPYIVRQKLKSMPRLLPHHKEARLEFGRRNMSTDWKKIIFSDEKKFNLDGPDGFNSYWRDLRKEPRYFSKRNFGGGSLMVWGAFCIDGMLELAFPSTRMNSGEYTTLLRTNLLPYLETHRTENLSFQQDNASVHKSNETRSWLKTHNVEVLQWPACSPDQNPIENIWGILVRKIFSENKQYENISELKMAVIEAWESIGEDVRVSLVESMPNRIFELIQNNGGPTHY